MYIIKYCSNEVMYERMPQIILIVFTVKMDINVYLTTLRRFFKNRGTLLLQCVFDCLEVVEYGNIRVIHFLRVLKKL